MCERATNQGTVTDFALDHLTVFFVMRVVALAFFIHNKSFLMFVIGYVLNFWVPAVAAIFALSALFRRGAVVAMMRQISVNCTSGQTHEYRRFMVDHVPTNTNSQVSWFLVCFQEGGNRLVLFSRKPKHNIRKVASYNRNLF